MMPPAPALPRWVPAIAALALVVLADPGWIDFEGARRGVLLLLVGTLALTAPRWLLVPAPGQRWLCGMLVLGALAAGWNAADLSPADAALRLLHLFALLLLARLGAAGGRGPWSLQATCLLPVVAIIGLLQHLGIDMFGSAAGEPVSLFGNRNVAAEFVAVAGAAVAVGLPDRRRLATVALVLGGAYAVANGSRSALVALPAACIFVAFAARERTAADRWRPLLAVLLGAALGSCLGLLQPAPGTPAAADPRVGNDTIEVRLEIATSGLAMVADAPLLGCGPGQFAVQYPRYRSQREIELSSLGRAQHRRVGTAHDDWLELAIEGGVPAALLLLGYVVSRWQQARGDRVGLAPLVALGLLMWVRSPVGNAPAVALALLASASSTRIALPPPRRSLVLLRAAGLVMAGIGGLVTLAASLCARGAAAAPEPTAATWIERSVAVWPFDPTPWQLLTGLRGLDPAAPEAAAAALQAIDRALALRPFEPSYRLQRADLLRWLGRFAEAKQELAEVARLDAGEPRVNVQLAGIYFTQRDVEGAIAALCTAPPPPLRRDLARRFDEFARLSQQAGDADGSRRCLAEAAFVRALDATGASDARGHAIAAEHCRTMTMAFAAAGLHGTDLREYIVLALRALDLGDPRAAAEAARAAGGGRRQLLAWQWSLLQPHAARLRAVDGWSSLLPSAP